MRRYKRAHVSALSLLTNTPVMIELMIRNRYEDSEPEDAGGNDDDESEEEEEEEDAEEEDGAEGMRDLPYPFIATQFHHH